MSRPIPPPSKPSDISDDQHESRPEDDDDTDAGISLSALWAFYSSHALFMSNNRSYEFASVLFTASAYPDTLVAASIRGLSAHLSSVLLSPVVGHWLDVSSRLRPVQICIVLQRVSIALASLGWLHIMHQSPEQPGVNDFQPVEGTRKDIIFALLIVLGMLERLSTVGNQLVVERDWLPLLAIQRPVQDETLRNPEETTPLLNTTRPKLHFLNATTKRIDLIAKLVTPLAVSAAALGLQNIRWVAAILSMVQLVCCVLELYLTRLVWLGCPALRKPKNFDVLCSPDTCDEDESDQDQGNPKPTRGPFVVFRGQLSRLVNSLKTYARNPISLPSIAYAIEPFSVLTLAGSMSAYLLVAHFPLASITMARTACTAAEIFSTILTPLLVSWFTREQAEDGNHIESDSLQPLVKVGILGLSWQFICLIPATIVLFIARSLQDPKSAPTSSSSLTIVLFASLALSRLGPFAYSLVEQQIVQLEVPEQERMQFSGVEMSLLDLAELLRWGMLGVFSQPGEFRWVAIASLLSILLSLVLFLKWVRASSHKISI